MLPAVLFRWCPFPEMESLPSGRPLRSKGPGAIVFILCKSPPLFNGLGLAGAYIGSPSYLGMPKPPYPLDCGGRLCAVFEVGNGGKGESRFEDNGSGDGGLCMGAVALRIGFPNGDCRPYPGDILLDGEALTGVS